MIDKGTSVPSAPGAFTSSETISEKSAGFGGTRWTSTARPVFASVENQVEDRVQDVKAKVAPGLRGSAVRLEIVPSKGRETFWGLPLENGYRRSRLTPPVKSRTYSASLATPKARITTSLSGTTTAALAKSGWARFVLMILNRGLSLWVRRNTSSPRASNWVTSSPTSANNRQGIWPEPMALRGAK